MVRIGVVGAGFMGRSFAQIIRGHPAATLAGVADFNLALADRVASELSVPSYPDTAAIVEAGNLDGVIIATVEHDHVTPCVTALNRGIAVLVEKPLATTLEDAQTIIAAADRAGALLTVGHVLHFDNRYVTVRQQIESGSIGEPLLAYARRLNGAAGQARLKGRVSLPMFLGVHDYDIVRWMIGSEPVQVTARERRGFLKGMGWDVEDASVAMITFANGALATVELSWVLPDGHPTGFDQRLDINGTTGRAELVGHYAGVTMMSAAKSEWPDTQLWPTINGEIVGALEKETHHFIECIQHGREPFVSANDGLVAVKIALAAEQSAATGQSILV